ncbi:RsiV family protein [Alistipes sp.]|uniref:RsiV family protein n=1 Tax=Alistipes sp. TaxID=1872444 RepID=UPI003AB65520
MKHAILFTLLASLLAVGCERVRQTQPVLEYFDKDTTFTVGNVRCDVNYNYLTIANASRSEALQAIEEANMGYFFNLESFSGTPAEAFETSLKQLTEELGPGSDGENNWDATINVESQGRVVDSLLVYCITRSSYTGGAHGLQSTDCHNYSLRGGYELTLIDLFDKRQQEALGALIRTKLYDMFGVTGDEGLTEQGFFPEYIDVTENFRITPEGIVFLYNPYDIGCYALGYIEVTVTGEELETL